MIREDDPDRCVWVLACDFCARQIGVLVAPLEQASPMLACYRCADEENVERLRELLPPA